MVIPQVKSSTVTREGQSGRERTRLGYRSGGLCLIVVSLLLVGCRSVYHDSWATLPARSEDRFKLRMQEAREANERVIEAARQLMASLDRTANDELVQIGFDRLEWRVFDLRRKVLAFRDEISKGGGRSPGLAEFEVLENQVQVWEEFVRDYRARATQAVTDRLRVLLQP